MPKNGSSRRKRRARRLASEENLRYIDALRRSSTGERELSQPERGLTALEALAASVERVAASDPADTTATLTSIWQTLALTATANDLIGDALAELGQVYWPGRDFLDDARRDYLARAVDTLGSTLGTSPMPRPWYGRMEVLTAPDVAPRVYHPFQPDGYAGVVCDADPAEKQRQVLLFRTQSVASANRSAWTAVDTLLGRSRQHVRDPRHRKAFRIAAVVVKEILHPEFGSDRRVIDQRILAIEVGRRSTEELVADDKLMHRLHESVVATAQPSGWSSMSAVSAALRHADPDWTPARWGHKSDVRLIAATKRFSIRHLSHEGQQAVEVRPRDRRAGRPGPPTRTR
ncbi:hypothetical protein [Nocardia brasiliensis]|uniref:hypothetical protein n=1 Tax=Nocardia brasiliensis TaxID=37326 RepID=UPI003D8B329A